MRWLKPHIVSGFLVLILWLVILVNVMLANALVEVKFYYEILSCYITTCVIILVLNGFGMFVTQ